MVKVIMSDQEALQSSHWNAEQVESKWTEYWFSRELFNLWVKSERPNYSIALPPPNITGNLHMGHALNGTLQDVLIRLKRMQGFNVLWQPGTDHAGISAQMVVEKKLRLQHQEETKKKPQEERKPFSRQAIGRENFINKVKEWREENGNQIMHQYKKLGVSFNWDRVAYTMDEDYVKAIYRAFVTLYKEGQIYRGKRITNWCPRCLTSLSDLEVEHKEEKGKLYHVKYKVVGSDKDQIVIATTRPESIFGDVAIAVNPTDARYKHLVGKKVRVPLNNIEVEIIEDHYVDKDFGTGALKITPAHDANDYEVGQRHNLPQTCVIDDHGKLIACGEVPEKYQGKDRFAVREAVVEELKTLDLLDKEEDYVHGVGQCERCATVIEPYLSEQWYLSMQELARPAIACVEEGKVKFIPERYESTYLDWMKNIRDWNISRQLWWGHRIPIWTCNSCQKEDAHEIPPIKCPSCSSTDLKQDEDVLDTWFSSALWPFATLGWPDETTLELKHFYPTTLLSTAREIINLWVARMIFMSQKFMKTVPFKYVLIHPVVQTEDGKRMSKSKGNAVDPLDMISKYGADANRFLFISMGVKGDQDVRFREERLEEYKRFVNKLFNVGKFVVSQLENYEFGPLDPEQMTLADKWIISKYESLLDKLDAGFANYDFDDVARDLYDFVWDQFCDWYVEIAKVQLQDKNESGQTKHILYSIFEGLMRAMHPIMPFFTEEMWSHLPKRETLADLDSIMFAPYPHGNPTYINKKAEEEMNYFIKVVRSVRNIKQTFDVPVNVPAEVVINSTNKAEHEILLANKANLIRLAKTNENPLPEYNARHIVPEGKVAHEIFGDTRINVMLDSLIDVSKTKEKILARKSAKIKELERIKNLLSSKGFLDKAPVDQIEKQKQQATEIENQIASFDAQLKILES
ncbi:MAG: valine--tRNA ligase [Candidatus Melainabacteria bacterium]|nr:valine--tRNA ligase [Candidatus Melainabacteria bacterium]